MAPTLVRSQRAHVWASRTRAPRARASVVALASSAEPRMRTPPTAPAEPSLAATTAAAAAWLAAAGPALADADPAAAPAAASSGLPFGFSPFEAALAVSPLIFYGVLTAYRALVNPKASISDVLFLVAALLIVGNLVSGLVFKVRLF